MRIMLVRYEGDNEAQVFENVKDFQDYLNEEDIDMSYEGSSAKAWFLPDDLKPVEVKERSRFKVTNA